MKKCFFCLLLCTILFYNKTKSYSIEIPLDGNTVIGQNNSNGNGKNSIGYVDIERAFNEHPMRKRMISEFNSEVEKRKKYFADTEAVIADMERIVVSSTTQIDQIKKEIEMSKKTVSITETKKILLPGTTSYIPAANFESAAVTNVNLSTSIITTPAVPTETITSFNRVQVSTYSLTPAEIANREKDINNIENGISAMKKDILKKREELNTIIKDNKNELIKLEEKQTETVMADLYSLFEKIAKEENLVIILDKNNVLYGHQVHDITDKVIERLQGR